LQHCASGRWVMSEVMKQSAQPNGI